MKDQKTTDELDALAKVARALDGLPLDAVQRILDYAAARHGLPHRCSFVPHYTYPNFWLGHSGTSTSMTDAQGALLTWSDGYNQGPLS